MLVLSSLPRTESHDIRSLRTEGRIPAVVYGPKQKPELISVDYQEFRKVLREVRRHQILELDVHGKKIQVLVKDFQKDKVRDTYTHIDFYATDSSVKVTVPVPVEFIGESPALRIGAILTVAMPNIKVKCFPSAIPAKISADISSLASDGDKIRVSDLEQFEGVEILPAKNILVAKAELSRAGKKSTEEETAAAATPAATPAAAPAAAK